MKKIFIFFICFMISLTIPNYTKNEFILNFNKVNIKTFIKFVSELKYQLEDREDKNYAKKNIPF